MTWKLILEEMGQVDQFRAVLASCLYETKQHVHVEPEDATWLKRCISDISETQSDDGSEDSEVEDVASESEDNEDINEAKNTCLAVGKATERSFVARGSDIGVFVNSPSKLQYHTAIRDIASIVSQKTFSPSKLYLHKADTNLLMLNQQDNAAIYTMDVERGAVVEEWVS